MSNKFWSGFIRRVSYDIELVSDLLVTTAAGVAYGYIEAFWVPTSIWQPSALRIFGRFAYYHIGFFALMLALTIGLVVTHYQWFDPEHHWAHIIYAVTTFSALLPLAFMVEDMTWFALQLRPIEANDWTMIWGLGLNLGFTWIPTWYIGTIVWTWGFLSIALTCARKSYQTFQSRGSTLTSSQIILEQKVSTNTKAENLPENSRPLIIVADSHLGLLSGKRFYLIPNNSASDTIGFAGFIRWMQGLESNTIEVSRGKWGTPLQIRKPDSLILLGDYLELWDSTDDSVDISSRGIWNDIEKLSCKKLYLVGNHDFEMTKVAGTYPQGKSSIEVLPNTYPPNNEQSSWLKIGGASYLFLHGHQFDWAFQHLGKAWTFVSYLRDGAEAFRLWSWVLTGTGLVALFAALFLPSNSILWSVALTLLIAVGLPRLIITLARPIWNYVFGSRYQASKELKNFESWWKNCAKNGKIPEGPLRVVYGHTHLIDIYDSNDFKHAGVDLPSSLTLVNIPSWVMDIRAEYSKILRDVALYVDNDDFHFLGWDWENQRPFYIPSDVARVIAAGISISGQIVQDLQNIGWPEKLLSKLQQPPRILSVTHPAPTLRAGLYAKLSG